MRTRRCHQRRTAGADRRRPRVLPIDDHAAALREDIQLLADTTYLNPVQAIAGFVYDVESGEIDDVARWERPIKVY